MGEKGGFCAKTNENALSSTICSRLAQLLRHMLWMRGSEKVRRPPSPKGEKFTLQTCPI